MNDNNTSTLIDSPLPFRFDPPASRFKDSFKSELPKKKQAQVTFKDPEQFKAFPALIVAANNGKCPTPEEFFHLKYDNDPEVEEIERSFEYEQQRLYVKYFKMLLPRLSAKKLAAHLAFLCEEGVLDKARMTKMFEVGP